MAKLTDISKHMAHKYIKRELKIYLRWINEYRELRNDKHLVEFMTNFYSDRDCEVSVVYYHIKEIREIDNQLIILFEDGSTKHFPMDKVIDYSLTVSTESAFVW